MHSATITNVVVALASFTLILYKSITSFTRLRLSCLIVETFICVRAVYQLLYSLGAIERSWVFWLLIVTTTYVYTTVLCAALLEMGRHFYPSENWNTKLFKIAVFGLIAFNVFNVSLMVLIILHQEREPGKGKFVTQLISAVVIVFIVFLYAFLPVVRVHFSAQAKNCHDDSHNVCPKTVAIGTWYMMAIFTISILDSTLSLSALERSRGAQLGFSIDSVIRSILATLLALPPPKPFVNITTELLRAHRGSCSGAVEVPENSDAEHSLTQHRPPPF